MTDKKQDFVVSDRRRFGVEGELRTDVAEENEQKSSAPPTPPPAQPAEPAKPEASAPPQSTAGPEAAEGEASQELAEPPTAEEQHEQTEAYKASGKKLDDLIAKSGNVAANQGPLEMNFERVIESFYMSALIQMGALRQEGETPRVDIIGARQTIDSLNVLLEKTKGNLTDRENTLLQNVMFELRMAWIEITNAIAAGPPPGAPPIPGAPGGIKK